jgi:hypothetical protein
MKPMARRRREIATAGAEPMGAVVDIVMAQIPGGIASVYNALSRRHIGFFARQPGR